MSVFMKEHWNEKFSRTPLEQLGWYEADPQPSLELIEACGIPHSALVADIGSGATTLIPRLLALGYQNLLAVDISEVAISKARSMLAAGQAARVRWRVEDVTDPSAEFQAEKIALWHDRAAFHFLTAEEDRRTYRSLAQKLVMPGGFMILAAFAAHGAAQCSGLPVQRYAINDLAEFFGEWFKPVQSLDYVYTQPSGGLRPYVYVRFQKI